jgi:5-methylcytosine-specific restriction protein A
MTTWNKETDKIFLAMWGHSSPADIAAAVNRWHSDDGKAKNARLLTVTTARGVMYHALKLGLISSAEVSLFDQRQKSDRQKRGYISSQIRKAVLQRDHQQCLACGSQDTLTVAHITPISQGGNSEIENLQTLCSPCQKDNHAYRVNFRKPFTKQWCSHCGREHYKNTE